MITIEHLKELEKRPRSFKGVITYPHKEPKFKESMKVMQSWLKKAIRRGDPQEVQQCILLQCYSGFFLDVVGILKKTFFFEDIGFGDPGSLVIITSVDDRLAQMAWPLSEKNFAKSVFYLLELGQHLARAKKSRLVSSYANSAVLNIAKKDDGPDGDWEINLNRFNDLLEACHAEPIADLNEFLLLPQVKKLMHATAKCFFMAKKMRSSALLHELWKSLDAKSLIIDTAKGVFRESRDTHSSLMALYFALLFYVTRGYADEERIIDEASTFGTSEKIYKKLSDKRLQQRCQSLLHSGQDIAVPDYAFDMHVRKVANGLEKFFEEGSFVPERLRFGACKYADEKLHQYLFEIKARYEEFHGPGTSRIVRLVDNACHRWGYTTLKRSAPTGSESVKKKPAPPAPVQRSPPFDDVPVAKTITTKSGKYVSIFDRCVLKGPYDLDKPQEKGVVDMVLKYHKKFRWLEKFRDLGYFTTVNATAVVRGGQTFLRFTNIGDIAKAVYELRSNRFCDDVRCVKRGSMVKRLLDYRNLDKLSDDLLGSILNHLYLRYILGIGNGSLGNILIHETMSTGGKIFGKACGIAMEKRRSFADTPSCKAEMLFGPAVKNQNFWESHLDKVVVLEKKWTRDNLPQGMYVRFQNYNEK